MKVVGARIREARRAKGISQEAAAVLAEMHVTSYGVLERGLGNPELFTLIAIAEALEVDPGSLIAGLTKAEVPATTHRLTASQFVEEQNRRRRG